MKQKKSCVSEPTWLGVPTEDRPGIWPVPPAGPPPLLDWLDPGELPVWGMIRSVSIMMAAPINGIETGILSLLCVCKGHFSKANSTGSQTEKSTVENTHWKTLPFFLRSTFFHFKSEAWFLHYLVLSPRRCNKVLLVSWPMIRRNIYGQIWKRTETHFNTS